MIPMEYDFLNIINARSSPGVVHASDNATAAFFRRYFMEKAVSVFKLDCPETWPKNFFWYVLYGLGFIAVVDIPGYGVIPQNCTLKGRNVFYQPAEILITNPALVPPGPFEFTIDRDCVLIRLTPEYCGIMDIIDKYADLMAVTAEALGINLMNSKLAYIFASKNKTAAESFKKMFDNIQRGQPAQFVDKDLFTEEGDPNWMTFSEELNKNFISPDLISVWTEIEHRFEQEIGIPNAAGTQKKERLITDEVNMNNLATFSKAELWLENLQDGAKKVKQMFGVDMRFEWRHKPQEGGSADAGDDVSVGALQV